MAVGEVYLLDDWSDVERRLAAKHGQEAGKMLRHLQQREAARYGSENLMVKEIGRGRDLFSRNLKALEYVARGQGRIDRTAVRQLYDDALADLKSIYPPGVKSDSVDFYEVWKHVLDAARDDADKKAGE